MKCRMCGTEIGWIGVCEDCTALLVNTGVPSTEDRLRLRGVLGGLVGCSWGNWKDLSGQSSAEIEMNSGISSLRCWRGDPPIVVLVGGCGTGKTHAAIATLRRFAAENGSRRSFRMWQETDLLRLISSASGFDGTRDEIHRQVFSVDLLVYDDLGASRSTDFTAEQRASILTGRIDGGKWTIITTNLSQREIAERISERLASRLETALTISTNAQRDFRRANS